MTRVLVLDPVHEDGLSILKARGDIELVHVAEYEATAVATELARAEVLVLRGRTLPPEMFEAAPNLRLISRHGVGCDNLDFDLLRARSVTVAIAADSNLVSVAEHAMTLTLAAAKNLVAANRFATAGGWAAREAIGAFDLAGSAVLVVGYGRIGRAFARLAAAFGARLTVFDPVLDQATVLPEGTVRAHDLDEALPAARVVSLHLPRSEETVGLFDARRLGRLSPGSILVNTSRGGIVDETALLSALDLGRPLRYATDVLAEEPPGDHTPLLEHPSVIVTPHSGAMTAEGAQRMSRRAAQNVLDFIDGRLSPEMVALDPHADAGNKT